MDKYKKYHKKNFIISNGGKINRMSFPKLRPEYDIPNNFQTDPANNAQYITLPISKVNIFILGIGTANTNLKNELAIINLFENNIIGKQNIIVKAYLYEEKYKYIDLSNLQLLKKFISKRYEINQENIFITNNTIKIVKNTNFLLISLYNYIISGTSCEVQNLNKYLLPCLSKIDILPTIWRNFYEGIKIWLLDQTTPKNFYILNDLFLYTNSQIFTDQEIDDLQKLDYNEKKIFKNRIFSNYKFGYSDHFIGFPCQIDENDYGSKPDFENNNIVQRQMDIFPMYGTICEIAKILYLLHQENLSQYVYTNLPPRTTDLVCYEQMNIIYYNLKQCIDAGGYF
jgi:hypothetical protein